MKRILQYILIFIIISSAKLTAFAIDYSAEYASTIYNAKSGLNAIEVNAIAQTGDGYIWAGTYSGLYSFDGSSFTQFKQEQAIHNVMELYTDSEGRLWIGTNDNGVACYSPDTEELIQYTTSEGLASDSIRAICEDSNGNIYVGTTDALSMISATGVITTFDNLRDITCPISLCYSPDGILGGVTNSGVAFFLKDNELVYSMEFTLSDGVYFTSICNLKSGGFLLGTSNEQVYSYALNKNNNQIYHYANVPAVSSISYLLPEKNGTGYFVCADNGCGYIDSNREFTLLNNTEFFGSVCSAIQDQQGNIWFASNKQGINKLSKNIFIDIFKIAGLENHIVNAIAKRNDELFVACDDGLFILNETTYQQVSYSFLSQFDGIRIRNVMTDSKGNVWISTYGTDGLVRLDKNNDITCYNESTADTMGGRFRLSIELTDGTILAASTTGLTFIKDGTVTGTIGKADGLSTPQILTLVEKEDGTILAGSDGDGIYIIKDKKVFDHIGSEEGLETTVILRIVPCADGYLYITSNSIYYDNGKAISQLQQFPYSNNYDAYISNDGEVWITGSAGIHIVNEAQLLADQSYRYTLLNSSRGFHTTLNANSWNYVDSDENLYLCCSTGIQKINISEYNNVDYDYNIAVRKVTIDNGESIVPENDTYIIPASNNRIEITPAVMNYTFSNPTIRMYLDGFGDAGITLTQNELEKISFTNLPYGNYNFHLQILNNQTLEVEKEIVIPIKKEAYFYEYTWFTVLVILLACGVIVFVTWLLANYQNIKVIKKQNEELQIARDAAEEANQAKGQFLANMSHEIRTPINTIMGMDELILRENTSPMIHKYASDIQSASASLLSIINDILDFSKIESGKMNIVEQEYNTAALMRDLINMLQVRAKEKNLTVNIEIDTLLPTTLYGDNVRVKQIILNLLSNAVKYTEKGSITFTVNVERVTSGKVAFTVKVTDTGIGIREEDIGKLFETFKRLDEKKNAQIQGTGLGLNISKELLERMGSKLEVTSTYGKGSTFYFTLTQGVANETPMGDVNIEETPSETSTKHTPLFSAPDAQILVVDDTQMNLAVVKALLKVTNMKVDTATNGKDCLAMIAKQHYDIILLDHMMPDMDGIETLEQIKSTEHLCKDTPVIALTANAIEGSREFYLTSGFHDYISKPISGKDLEKVLFEYLPEEKRVENR